jgi:exodeoxyribonuclease VII small subunit
MNNELTYQQAQQKLEEIVAQMENNEIDLETLSNKLIEAKNLVKLCETKLRKIEENIDLVNK